MLVRMIGPALTLAATATLFGAVHMTNLNASPFGIANTAGFGIVLGYAFLRSGALWLPIGIHFGWNWILPAAGVNLSGFKIGITGYVLRWSVGDIWSGGAYGPGTGHAACDFQTPYLRAYWGRYGVPEEHIAFVAAELTVAGSSAAIA